MTLLWPALDSQYQNGRSFAGNRALAWGPLRRAVYALGTVLLPPLRMWRVLRRSAPDMTGRVLPLTFAMLIAASLGELVGYLLGPGRSMNRLSAYELQRDRWVYRLKAPLIQPLAEVVGVDAATRLALRSLAPGNETMGVDRSVLAGLACSSFAPRRANR